MAVAAFSFAPLLLGQEMPDAPERLSAAVESLTATVIDTFPPRVDVELAGWLPDACAWIELVVETAIPGERRVALEVSVVRPPGMVCAQVLTPFHLRIPLDISGFADGDYTVAADEAEARFVIEPVGDFPVLSLPAVDSASRIIVPGAGLALVGPSEWQREGLVWSSPPYWSAQIGLRWHEMDSDRRPEDLLPPQVELHESSESRLGWATGMRFRVSRESSRSWSEHLFVRCGQEALCEFWMQAPSEPLLEAAGEAFWRMVRFVARLPE